MTPDQEARYALLSSRWWRSRTSPGLANPGCRIIADEGDAIRMNIAYAIDADSAINYDMLLDGFEAVIPELETCVVQPGGTVASSSTRPLLVVGGIGLGGLLLWSLLK